MPETTLTFLNTGSPTGLKFVVEHGDRRCLFDFGVEYAPGRALFSQGLLPRPGREVADLVVAGAAPRVEGVYAEAGGWDGRTALFISHLHLDHTSLVRYVDPAVPLHYPAPMEPVRAGADAAGYLPWRHPVGSPIADRKEVAWGPIGVQFVAVDHDVPGASGFLVRTPDLYLAFTGDQRWHGLHPELTAGFADAARGCDVLVQEGVCLGLPAGPRVTEQEVLDGMARLLEASQGLVLVNLTPVNRERVAGFAAAARAAGRVFVMEPGAALMAGFAGATLSDDLIAQVRAEPARFLVQLGFESLPMLIDLGAGRGAVYVHSNGPPLAPFDPAYAVMEGWVRQFGLEFVTLGTTGHSFPEDIERNVQLIRPRLVAPVHSMAPQLLEAPGVPCLLPEVGRVYRASELRGA